MRRIPENLAMIAALLVVLVAMPATAQAENDSGLKPNVVMPVKHGVSQPLRDLPKINKAAEKPDEIREVNPRNSDVLGRILDAEKPSGPVDTAVQDYHFAPNMPDPSVNFEGVGNVNGVLPPDTTGDVGPNHYVQWVNLSYAVFDKTGGVLSGPHNGNVLWTGFGGSCEAQNAGDPIVLYDHLADRWFMSQFTGDNHQCIAVSQTGDPLGAWYLYDYLADAGSGWFPDYPKFGVWPDGYYYTASMFGNGSNMSGVFERDQMLIGAPAQFIWFYVADSNAFPSWRAVPADLDGPTLPPAGAPNPILQLVDDAWGYDPPFDQDGIAVVPLHVDWATPGNSTFGPPEMIDLTAAGYPFDSEVCGAFRGQCVPQPGGPPLETLQGQLMFKLQYRNFGTHETMMVSHTVDSDGAGLAGVRWYELRNSAGGWGIHQGSTFAPDTDHRWMGDVAMDASGNIAVGYSVSSTTVFPSIRWAGRLAGDPLDTLAQGEAEVMTGGGSQTHSAARWGDYSTMSIDPVDDCTFWYTQEYIETTGSAPWQTRVAAFSFPGCGGPSGTLDGTVYNAITMDPIEGAQVEANGFSTFTQPDGTYSFNLPIGTYDMTASAFGYDPGMAMGVEVFEATTTTQDFGLLPVTDAILSGWVTDLGHGWPLYAMIEISTGIPPAAPVATVYNNPFTGYYSIVLPAGTPYELNVMPMFPGYWGEMRGIVLDLGGQVESFILQPDPGQNCIAPGWELASGGLFEDFEGSFPPAGWAVIDDDGSGLVWSNVAGSGEGGNWAGTGDAASASSDSFGTASYDTYLTSPVVDFSEATTVVIEALVNFQNFAGYDYFEIEVSADGGSSWTNVFSWNEDHGGFRSANSGEPISVDVSAELAGSAAAQLRFRYYDPVSHYNWYVQVDDVFFGAKGCAPIPGAMAEGFVSDANTADGLNGADVVNDVGGATMTMATPGDPNIPDGFYYLFTPLPTGGAPAATMFTASYPDYADSMVDIVLAPEAVNQIDFALQAGWLELVPDFLGSYLYPGGHDHQPMAVNNYGGLEANVMLNTTAIPTTWPHLSPVKDIGNLPGNTDPTSLGRAPAIAGGQDSTPNPNLVLASVEAYGVDVFPGANLVDWPDVTVPGAWNVIAGGMGQFFAGDFLMGDFSKLYILDYGTNNFLAMDTTSGTQTVLGSSIPGAGEAWTGMTASVSGMLYASSAACGVNSTLYTVDPGTGATTPIGSITNGTCIIDIAINAAGEMYGVDIVLDNLVQIDPSTGAGTIVGSLGVDANYAQGMDFDEVSGVLYWASYSASGELRTLDTMTGASTLVGAFPGGAEVDSFAIHTFAGGGGGLPWLVLTPEDGVVPPMGNLPIEAQFLADGADHYGLYQARISVFHDTPYDVNDAAVCFTKSFMDMTPATFGESRVHSIAGARITTGCGFGNFCPTDDMTRGVMARWLLLSKYGADYSPPPCTGIFGDVLCETTANASFIEALYGEGITSGCNADPLLYCPNNPVTRDQMAVFLIRTLEGSDYVPPDCAGLFIDVACPGGFAVKWVEDLFNRGITAGCGAGYYCPKNDVSRAEMAVFVGKTFQIPRCGD